jgi:aspartyl-tRNA(Asn)/glutamyl-tRNA(Gln) amidotransferase subunit B
MPLADIGSLKLTPARLASIIVMQEEGKINSKAAKETAEDVLKEDAEPLDIVRKNNREQITDPAQIREAVAKTIAAESKAWAEYKAALTKPDAKKAEALKAWLVGKVLAATAGRADPKLARAELERN